MAGEEVPGGAWLETKPQRPAGLPRGILWRGILWGGAGSLTFHQVTWEIPQRFKLGSAMACRITLHTSCSLLHGARIWNRSPNVVIPADQGGGLSRNGDQRGGQKAVV